MKTTINSNRDFLNALKSMPESQLQQQAKIVNIGNRVTTQSICEIEISEEPFFENGDAVGYKSELQNEGFTEEEINENFNITEPIGTVIIYIK